jgi:hypothetical protein
MEKIMTVKNPGGAQAWAEHLESAGNVTPEGIDKAGPDRSFHRFDMASAIENGKAEGKSASEAFSDMRNAAGDHFRGREQQLKGTGVDKEFAENLYSAEKSYYDCYGAGDRNPYNEQQADQKMQGLVDHLQEKGHPAADPARDFKEAPINEAEKWDFANRDDNLLKGRGSDQENKAFQLRNTNDFRNTEQGQEQVAPSPAEKPVVQSQEQIKEASAYVPPQGMSEGISRLRGRSQGGNER